MQDTDQVEQAEAGIARVDARDRQMRVAPTHLLPVALAEIGGEVFVAMAKVRLGAQFEARHRARVHQGRRDDASGVAARTGANFRGGPFALAHEPVDFADGLADGAAGIAPGNARTQPDLDRKAKAGQALSGAASAGDQRQGAAFVLDREREINEVVRVDRRVVRVPLAR